MHALESKQYIVVQQPFTIKGSRVERFLLNLRTRKKYALDEEQAAFLESCNGSEHIGEILADYDSESREVALEFLRNLESIGAIAFSPSPTRRTFTPAAVDPQLQSVHFEITSRCSMDCLHCYQKSYLRQPSDLSFAEIVHLIEDLRVLNVEKVGLSGGEPLDRPDLFDIIRVMEEHEIAVSSILTNGLRLNTSTIEQIRNCQSQFPIFVSLDGIRPEAMNLRGVQPHNYERVFNRLIANIVASVAAGISVMINTVVTRDNLADLPAMYHRLRDLGVRGWRLALPKFAGAYPEHAARFAIDRTAVFAQYLEIIKQHLVEREREGDRFRLQIEHFFRIEVFENLEVLSPNAFVCDYEGKRQSICIKPNGDVTPCPLYLSLVLGNVRTRPLGEIWYSDEMRRVKDIRICDVRGCTSCDLSSLCATGCRANAIFLHGSTEEPDDDACAATRFFIMHVAPLLRDRGISIPTPSTPL